MESFTEILSPILIQDKDFRESLKYLLGYLETNGEPNCTFRSGMHIHCSYEEIENVSQLKRILKLASMFEPLFFYLGGMGYTYRGIFNDSIYCRPITKFGPPVGNSYWGSVQILTLKRLSDVDSLKDFWFTFGNMYKFNTRYTQPARYSWINLCGLNPTFENAHNTLEFRIFNKSLNYEIVNAVITFCLEFCKMCMDDSTDFTYNEFSIFDSSKSDAYKLLDMAKELFGLDHDTLNILRRIISGTPEIRSPEFFVRTHKKIGSVWSSLNTEFLESEVIDSNNIKYPKFIDRHAYE